jgi:hypothetical protein
MQRQTLADRLNCIASPFRLGLPSRGEPALCDVFGRAFREDFNELRREFASVQTAWRREVNSNLRYSFTRRKRRRVRNLHGINHFREFCDCALARSLAKQCGSDSPSIHYLKANGRRCCG